MEKTRIFISYKRKNKDQVFSIVNKIETQLGVKCWVDLDGIESSAQFASKICKAIDTADVVLFMHSSVHLDIDFENDWTIKELNYAHAKKKRVVLVKLDNASLDNIFLMEYGSKNNIDSQDETQFQKLLKDLKAWLIIPEQSSKDTSRASRILGNKYRTKIQTFYYEDGKKQYEGETQNGLYHGHGTYYFPDGEKYEGQFEYNNFHGQGTYYFANGNKYIGEYNNDKRHGQGIYYFANGDKYEGQFEDGKFHGQGTYYYANGNKYEGQFMDYKFHGQGTYYFANGDKYEGQFKDNKFHGQGTYHYTNGNKFVGLYENGIKHGQGTWYYPNGDQEKRNYNNGLRI